MPETGGFKITNSRAPFIVLTEILKSVKLPQGKDGDIKWLDENIDKVGLSKDQVVQARDLIDILIFRKGRTIE